tara:strand:- start:5216 stop:6319 length:1104 start_codon:yes stop_codon:yes gene_type:complete
MFKRNLLENKINYLMKIIKKIFVNIIFYVFLILLYIIFFEIISRTIISATSKNLDIFKYGFNKNLIFEIADLTDFEFTVTDVNLDQKKYIVDDLDKKEEILNKNNENLLFWIFGASLTYGFACGDASSSWPDELSKKNKIIKIKNFAFPGKYSDDSIKILIHNYKNKNIVKPHLVIWTHRDEELLSIARGIKRNKSKIDNNFSFQKYNSSHTVLLTIDKTFKSNFSFYVVFNHMVNKLKIRFGVANNSFDRKKLTDKDWSLAIKNFELNTIEAINLANENNVQKFVILSLFAHNEVNGWGEDQILKPYFKTLDTLRKYKNVKIINTVKFLSDEEKLSQDSFFCENKHFNLKGHKLISDIVYDELFIN